jgi:hypothetical protein
MSEAEAQVAMSNSTGIAKPAAILEATRILALATTFPCKREQATIFQLSRDPTSSGFVFIIFETIFHYL